MPSPRRNISQRSELLYDIHNWSICLDTREIFVCNNDDEINSESASSFIKNMRVLNNISHDPILIHMMIGGGSFTSGFAMYDAIKASESDTVVLSYVSESMSSVIPQAATWRVVMPSVEYLLHYGQYHTSDNYSSVVASIDSHKKSIARMIDLYVDRMCEGQFCKRERWTKEQLRAWLTDLLDKKQELFLRAHEVVDMGLADGVLGEEGYETIAGLREE